MDDMYRENILDHYRNPTHFGVMEDSTVVEVGTNPLCGDEATLYAKVVDGVASELSFQGKGCAISVAATSILLEEVTGQASERIMNLQMADIQGYLGIPLSPARIKCALLGLITLQTALRKAGEAASTPPADPGQNLA